MTPALRTWRGLLRSLVIYWGRPWHQAALARFYAGLLPRGGLAFDIGAHVGNRTAALRRAGLRVVALEPQPVFYRFLKRTQPAETLVLPLALGRAAGTARMRVSRLHPTVSSLRPGIAAELGPAPGFERVDWDAEARVEVTTLDHLIAREGRPDFVKLDVEGFEAEVLAGLSAPLPLLAFEYLPAAIANAIACIERLTALGNYRFNLVEGEALDFAFPEWVGAEAMRARLSGLDLDALSGDVYARLIPPMRADETG